MYPMLATCCSCLLLLRHSMLKSRLCKGWRLIRLCLSLIGRHPLKHRVVPDSRELSCKLLVYRMKLSKSLLKLWGELPVRRWRRSVPMAMAVPRRMNVIVWWWWRCRNVTLCSWSLGCISDFINLQWVLWNFCGIQATMCILSRGGLPVLAWCCCGR